MMCKIMLLKRKKKNFLVLKNYFMPIGIYAIVQPPVYIFTGNKNVVKLLLYTYTKGKKQRNDNIECGRQSPGF